MAAARLLAERGFPIDDAAITRGIAGVRWPGRLERVGERPTVYIDGTHNPAGARELVAFWDEQFPGVAIHLVYGTLRDKPIDEICGVLFPRAANVILTEPRQSRALKAETLADMTRHLAPDCRSRLRSGSCDRARPAARLARRRDLRHRLALSCRGLSARLGARSFSDRGLLPKIALGKEIEFAGTRTIDSIEGKTQDQIMRLRPLAIPRDRRFPHTRCGPRDHCR